MSGLKRISGVILAVTIFCFHSAVAQQKAGGSNNKLQAGFAHPPDSIKTSIYWYWISDNISKEGVIRDLQAMKQVGINRAFIGNIALPEVAYGKVKIFSDEWWDILHTALKTATALNIEIGIFNSPGWSQSGGPWVKPSQSMRYLTSSDTMVKGPGKFLGKLALPGKDFQDVKLIAFRAPHGYGQTISSLKPQITSSPVLNNLSNIMDGRQDDEIPIKEKQDLVVDIKSQQSYPARSIIVYPAHRKMKFSVKLEALGANGYAEIANFIVDRSNVALNVGFEPYAPVAISFPETNSGAYRLHFTNATAGSAITEVELSSAAKTERYVEKTLAKMYPTPLPYWKEYQWASQPVVTQENTIIQPSDVIDISRFMDADGTLTWNIPAGNWVIRRTGMVSTLVTNGPASAEGTGLETDKMSKKHIRSHFDAFLGEILRRIPAADRKTWKVVVEDSYETGGQNWTDGLMDQFKSVYGYDMLPFLPVMQGDVVGSHDQSDRFLWDLRRLIADKVSYDYVAGLREVSHQHGLTTWLENYGHWGFPGEFLQYGGQSDEIGGEFWSEGELGNIENRAASSCAHIYGKRKVSAESFTCGGAAFSRYPAMMKSRGDRFFTEGINNTLLHLCISQPDEDRVPGINAPFGNEFNRKNTWYPQLDQFIHYLKRCNLMLQQGRYVADVAYFIGEDAPKMTGVRDPELPKGYAYDYINADVLKTRISVKNGRLSLPDGLSYKILVLPKLETMRPELLARIKELVMQGAVVLGPAPTRSPSLQGFPGADARIKTLGTQLWGNAQEQTKFRTVGKGLVMSDVSLEEAMDYLKMHPDFETREKDPVLYIHRSLGSSQVYFLSNQTGTEITINPIFNVSGLQPWLWDATTGKTRLLADFSESSGRTTIPLKFVANESAFIVFAPKTGKGSLKAPTNYPIPKEVVELPGPWNLSFTDQISKEKKAVVFEQLTDWSTRPEEWIRHFSGQANYTKNFRMDRVGKQVILDLGSLSAMAEISVNGKKMGGVWTPPYRLDITDALKTGENKINIMVVNTWVNRIIGETALAPGKRKIWMDVNPYNAESKLEASGLLGPVKILNY